MVQISNREEVIGFGCVKINIVLGIDKQTILLYTTSSSLTEMLIKLLDVYRLGNIYDQVMKLIDKQVMAVAAHIQWNIFI